MACDISNNGSLKSNCDYIQNKIQKITEALYRVTDLFSNEEPLKWMLRKQGVNIFNNLQALDKVDLHARVKNIESASEAIMRILGVLELSSAGTFISGINFEVLRREYLALHDFMNANKENILPEPIRFFAELDRPSPILFEGLMSAPRSADGETAVSTLENAKDIKGQNADNGPMSVKNANGQEKKFMDIAASAKNNGVQCASSEHSPEQGHDSESDVRLERQKKILEFIRHNGWVGAGEVSNLFADAISEKTIQRDLIYMADSGIIRKAGDKRWRRYAAV